MKTQKYHVLGVMSGTSLDGIDLAECIFEHTENAAKKTSWQFSIGATTTVPYASNWKKRLQEAVSFSEAELITLNCDYTDYLSEVIKNFIGERKLHSLDAICSHGHTILHQPDKGITLQIGNLPQLATRVQKTVVCDFRVQDVALGGQGAPLVPIGDRLLFGNYEYCLNLGGFANCSFERKGKRIAYDICPVNIVLNRYAQQLGQDYDDNGNIAASAVVDPALLQALGQLEFYFQPAPKSLGLEWVKTSVFPLLEESGCSSETILATFTEHIAMQLAAQFESGATVMVTGGGAYNSYLLERLKQHAAVEIVCPSKTLIEYKEALIFGLLGVLKIRGEVNCLASVTGAKKDHSSGEVFIP